jgi:hypothetical protein
MLFWRLERYKKDEFGVEYSMHRLLQNHTTQFRWTVSFKAKLVIA